MKIAMTLVVVLLCAAVGRADSYTATEQVSEPEPGLQVLSFSIEGPTVAGDDLVAGFLGITSNPHFIGFGLYQIDYGGKDFTVDNVILGTDYPVNYSFSGVFNLPSNLPTAAPEPGTLLLLGSGFAGLVLLRRW